MKQRQGRYRFVAVATEPVTQSQCAAELRLGFSVFMDPTPKTDAAYRIQGTPETYVLGTDGRLMAHWYGAYGQETLGDVERFFHLRLPGVQLQ
ncbi:MAG: hypothetical protein ACRD1C_11860 [Terriglobales bacterium]